MRKLLLFIPLITGLLSLNAQTQYCGTLQTEEDLQWLRNHQQNYVPNEDNRGGTTYYIPVKVHVVGSDEGTGYYNLSYIHPVLRTQRALCCNRVSVLHIW